MSNQNEILEVLAIVSEPLMRKYNEESSIGNLLTDYMKEAAQSDIAFLNSGAIRADFNTGDVTLEQLINVYPFKDNLTVIELTGNQIEKLIEYSLTLPYGIGQVSGLKIEYDSTQDEMKRIVDIKVNGNNKFINYKFYAREKKSIYGLDWNKIEVDLTKNNIINKGRKNNLNFKWLKSKDLSNFIEKKIIDNPYYLVKKNIK